MLQSLGMIDTVEEIIDRLIAAGILDVTKTDSDATRIAYNVNVPCRKQINALRELVPLHSAYSFPQLIFSIKPIYD
jgi:hypothetical protein